MAVIYGTIGSIQMGPENDTVYGWAEAMIIVCPVTTSCMVAGNDKLYGNR